ncbi:LacI family transcriptional regulator [Puniceicoccaceae bacterium K14]|nr:LacI family transcriptional regulator [Puniceicoccaceae bacterium K14]
MSKSELTPPLANESLVAQRITLRDIAKELNVSHVTVSKALRDLPGVSSKLKIRIQKKAKTMGYVPDPVLASLSNYRLSKKANVIQSEIAWVNPWKQTGKTEIYNEFDLYWKGALETANSLGYRLQEYKTSEFSLARLSGIFTTRNIQGVLIPPFREQFTDLKNFDWSHFAVVRFGQIDDQLPTHSVKSAQVSNTMLSFDHARRLGYKRIGFVCEYQRNRYFGAGFNWAQMSLPPKDQLPLHKLDLSMSFEKMQLAFNNWLNKYNPDCILADNSETHEMLSNLEWKIPQDIGLATTSIHDTSIDTGIDQRPHEIGKAAIRMLVALIAEKNLGIPECRNETLIEGKWIDGPMLPKKRDS